MGRCSGDPPTVDLRSSSPDRSPQRSSVVRRARAEVVRPLTGGPRPVVDEAVGNRRRRSKSTTTRSVCSRVEPMASASTAPPAARIVPRLGSGMRAFVINLERRPDRYEHISRVCQELGVDTEFFSAFDGQKLASLPGSRIVPLQGKTVPKHGQCASNQAERPTPRLRGFAGLKRKTYRAEWYEDGVKRSQLLRMASHRLIAGKNTAYGHELWGAVGCSLSHQAVLKRFLELGLDYALVLEDDAALLEMTAASAKATFNKGMETVVGNFPDWGLVYLGGHIVTNQKFWATHRVDDDISKGLTVYQSHAFVLRREVAAGVLQRLQSGYASDAALVSWARSRVDACFMFHPVQLLQQPGRAGRWKDSDIFREGEAFKRRSAKFGGKYVFRAQRKPRSGAPVHQWTSRFRTRRRAAQELPTGPQNVAPSTTIEATLANLRHLVREKELQVSHQTGEQVGERALQVSHRPEWTPGIAGPVAALAPVLAVFRMEGVRAMILAILPYICAPATSQVPRHHLQTRVARNIVLSALEELEADAAVDVSLRRAALEGALAAARRRGRPSLESRALQAARRLADKRPLLEAIDRAHVARFISLVVEGLTSTGVKVLPVDVEAAFAVETGSRSAAQVLTVAKIRAALSTGAAEVVETTSLLLPDLPELAVFFELSSSITTSSRRLTEIRDAMGMVTALDAPSPELSPSRSGPSEPRCAPLLYAVGRQPDARRARRTEARETVLSVSSSDGEND